MFTLFCLFLNNRKVSYAQNRQELKTKQLIVTFKNKPRATDLISLTKNKKKSKLKYSLTGSNSMVFEATGSDLDQAITEMKNDPIIGSVVVDQKLDLLYLPNDPSIKGTPAPGKPQIQWDMYNLNLAGSGRSAWDISKGSAQTVVAVMDSGVDSSQEDLAGKLVSLVNCAGTSCQTVSSMTANPANFDESHGTHVAGTIGAATDNNKGIAGSGFNTPLMIIKVRNTNGEMLVSYFVNAIRYAADHNARILNMSVGALLANLDGPLIAEIDSALSYAWSRGVLMVAAAGNCGRPAASHQANGDPCDIRDASGNFVRHAVNEKYYPAANQNVISVAALDINNNIAPYSEYNDPSNPAIGSWISVAAPGGEFTSNANKEWGIVSTWPQNQYFYDEGTSMAAPHVSGVAALIWSYKPQLTNSQVKTLIENYSNHAVSPGKTKFGLVNALASLDSLGGPTPSQIPIVSNTPVPPVSRTPTPFVSRTPTPFLSKSPTPSLFKTPTPSQTVINFSPTPTLINALSPTQGIGPSATPNLISPTAAPSGCNGLPSDPSCYFEWVFEYTGGSNTFYTDFNGDNVVDLIDFEIWRRSTL